MARQMDFLHRMAIGAACAALPARKTRPVAFDGNMLDFIVSCPRKYISYIGDPDRTSESVQYEPGDASLNYEVAWENVYDGFLGNTDTDWVLQMRLPGYETIRGTKHEMTYMFPKFETTENRFPVYRKIDFPEGIEISPDGTITFTQPSGNKPDCSIIKNEAGEAVGIRVVYDGSTSHTLFRFWHVFKGSAKTPITATAKMIFSSYDDIRITVYE